MRMQNHSCSIELNRENNKRLEHLYVSHSGWLKSVSYNITKNRDDANELVQELYLYLADKPNPSIYYSTSFNLMYCRAFLSSRFINGKKRGSRMQPLFNYASITDTEYDVEADERFEKCWESMLAEIDNMKKEKGWSAAYLFQMYMFSEDSLEEVSKKIGVSLSTTFMNVKKVKLKLREKLTNPFKEEDN
jgi:RNA polymerase sigma factor (sigma-70 family)